MVGRELASRFFEDRTLPKTTVRTFYVLSYACAQRRCHTARRPPHVMFLTRPSPSLAIFCVLRCARAEEGLGTRLLYTCIAMYTCKYSVHVNVHDIVFMVFAVLCRHLAQISSVDDQGRDTDTSFAARRTEDEVYMYM